MPQPENQLFSYLHPIKSVNTLWAFQKSAIMGNICRFCAKSLPRLSATPSKGGQVTPSLPIAIRMWGAGGDT